MKTLVRLSLRMPAKWLDGFEKTYRAQLLPILEKHQLKAAAARPAGQGIFSRFFEVESAAEFAQEQNALNRQAALDDAVAAIVQALGGGAEDWIYSELMLCTAVAGAGKSRLIGTGNRRGPWLTFNTLDGLSSAVIHALVQDRQGHLWFGTQLGGVSRFDGSRITTFTSADGLLNDYVFGILEDRQGVMWFATREGISRYDGESFTNFTAADGLLPGPKASLLEDRQGRLWIGGYMGVSCCNGISDVTGSSFTNFTAADGLGANGVGSILEDRQGAIWFATRGGLSRYNANGASDITGSSFTNFTVADGLSHDTICALAEDPQGTLWIGTDKGVTRFDGQGFTPLEPMADKRSVQAILANSTGPMGFGTASGFWQFDGEASVNLTVEGLNNSVNTMLQDRSGQVWIGTWGGLSRYDGNSFTTFTGQHGLADSGLMAVLQDRSGLLWIGTHSGVWSYDGQAFTALEGMADKDVWDIVEDRQGRLWFSTTEGVYYLDGQEVKNFNAPDKQINGQAFILCDGAGNLWFSLRGQRRIYRYDGCDFEVYTQAEGVDWSYAHLIQDRQGQIWAGLSRYTGQGFAKAVEGRPSHRLAEDRQGRLWTVAWGGGIGCYDGRDYQTFTVDDGLTSNFVLAVCEDRQGHLWFGTFGGGILRYDGRIFQSLTTRDGLVSDVVQDLIEDRHGNMWFATEGGLVRYQSLQQKPAIRLIDVVTDSRCGPVDQVEVSAAHAFVAFEFEGSSLSTRLGGMTYLYRLQGREEEWQTTPRRRVEYSDLALGNYTFQVQAVDFDFNHSEVLEVRLAIVPDPYIDGLTNALNAGNMPGDFVGASPALNQLKTQLRQVAPTDLTALILGETGTGKGLSARALHNLSPRQGQPFIQVNCGAIPEGLVESELFGHEKGAFTGATARQLGKVELAEGGTLFLDEIGDMPLHAQTKLLRFLEDRVFERVGGKETLKANVRLVAATNRDLGQMVEEGTFRRDLYFRLQIFPIQLPPLRQRQEDIPVLALYFAGRFAHHLNRPQPTIGAQALEQLQAYHWPGNVRELEHLMQRMVLKSNDQQIRVVELGISLGAPEEEGAEGGVLSLAEQEKRHIERALEHTGWVIEGQKGAAHLLQINAATLRSRMKKHGIQRPK